MKVYRQGDVVIKPESIPSKTTKQTSNILVSGVVTGHSHEITAGEFELYVTQDSNSVYLKILSEHAVLSHQEHEDIKLPAGEYSIKIQREYDWFSEEVRNVAD